MVFLFIRVHCKDVYQQSPCLYQVDHRLVRRRRRWEKPSPHRSPPRQRGFPRRPWPLPPFPSPDRNPSLRAMCRSTISSRLIDFFPHSFSACEYLCICLLVTFVASIIRGYFLIPVHYGLERPRIQTCSEPLAFLLRSVIRSLAHYLLVGK